MAHLLFGPTEHFKPRISFTHNLRNLAERAIGNTPGGKELVAKHFDSTPVVQALKPVSQVDAVLQTPGFTT